MGRVAHAASLLLLAWSFFSGTTYGASSEDMVCKQKKFEIALKFQQKSAVIEALQRQTYRLARMRFDDILAEHETIDDLAIITDVDETIVDNTRLLVRDMRNCHTYTRWDTWGHWEREGTPSVIPGAKAFLDHVDRSGVDIFYVSNRFAKNESHTIETMRQMGLPQVSPDTVKLWSEGNPKTKRRAAIEPEHNVIMLLGDSLADLQDDFEGSVREKRAAVAAHAEPMGAD